MIKKFEDLIKEAALSKQRAENARLALLVQTAREMIELYEKADEFDNSKRIKNAEIEQMLDEMKATSIIASGVLVEVIKPYETKRLDSKEYIAFVESAVDSISEEYKAMHAKAVELNTKLSTETKYLKFAKNSKALPSGEMTYEGILDTVKHWFGKFKESVKSLLKKFTDMLGDIKEQAQTFNNVQENVDYNQRDALYNSYLKELNQLLDSFNNKGLYAYPSSGFESQTRTFQQKGLTYYGDAFFDNTEKLDSIIEMPRGEEQQKVSDAIYRFINKVKKDGFDVHFMYGGLLFYDKTQNDADVNENAGKDAGDIAKVLQKAKDIIADAENEKYFLELAKVKEAQVIKMLEEFKAKSMAIDDKIVQLIRIAPKEKLSLPDYSKYMTNAELVGKAVSEMADNLFAVYSKVSQVSGSVRQFADDSGSPDGTLNAYFDYENKKVKLRESFTSFFKNLAGKIKKFISGFNMASKKADAALENIDLSAAPISESFATKDIDAIIKDAGYSVSRENEGNVMKLHRSYGISLRSVEDTEIDCEVTIDYMLYKEVTCKMTFSASSVYAKGWKFSVQKDVYDDAVDYENLDEEPYDVVVMTIDECKSIVSEAEEDAIESYHAFRSGDMEVDYSPDSMDEKITLSGKDHSGVPHDITITGVFKIAGIGGHTLSVDEIKLVGWERNDDDTICMYQDDIHKGNKVGGVVVKYASLRKLAQGRTIMAETTEGVPVKIQKVKDLKWFDYEEVKESEILDIEEPNGEKEKEEENNTLLQDLLYCGRFVI